MPLARNSFAAQSVFHPPLDLAARLGAGAPVTVGILGGGQLGRMLAIACAQLGVAAHIYAPEEDSPAFAVAPYKTVGAYEDAARLAQFAAGVDVITFEFESVPASALVLAAQIKPVRPRPLALAITQDRWFEKNFITRSGLTTAPFVLVENAGDIVRGIAALGTPAILKSRREGYDGKGQVKIATPPDLSQARSHFEAIGAVSAILEGFVDFAAEISVIGARAHTGDFVAYDVGENIHRNHILHQTHVPANVLPHTAREAVRIAKILAEELNYVGVLGVELFVVRGRGAGTEAGKAAGKHAEERLIVNEIAPRVHNSGHWTLDFAHTCQFHQHIRAICGWSLGGVHRYGPCVMENLIGDDILKAPALLAKSSVCLHLYGKSHTREGRKMGHFSRLLADADHA